MAQVPTELPSQAVPAISEAEAPDVRLRQYEVLSETTTQMLATPTLEGRLLLALEAIVTGLGHTQAAIAMINERDATLRVRAALGFEDEAAHLEMPLDSSAPCVMVVHEGRPSWIAIAEDEQSCALFGRM